jgi:hypothetical protein
VAAALPPREARFQVGVPFFSIDAACGGGNHRTARLQPSGVYRLEGGVVIAVLM